MSKRFRTVPASYPVAGLYFWWLHLLTELHAVSHAEVSRLNAAFFSDSALQDVEAWLAAYPSLARAAARLIRESVLLFPGRYSDILESTKDLENKCSETGDPFHAERLFLRMLAMTHCSGTRSPTVWNEAMQDARIQGVEPVLQKVHLEHAASLMQRGCFLKALEVIEHVVRLPSLDRFMSSRLHSIRFSCLLYLGRFHDARIELQALAPRRNRLSSESMRMAHLRRRISHFIESEQYEAAERELAFGISNPSASILTRLLLSHQRLQLLIHRQLTETAQASLAQLRRDMAHFGISEGLLSLFREESELALSEGRTAQVLKMARSQLRSATMDGNRALQVVAHTILAKTFALASDARTALKHARAALEIAQDEGFGRELVNVQIVASACHLRAGMESHAHELLLAALAHARQLGLPRISACATYLNTAIFSKASDETTLREVLKVGSISNEVGNYLRISGHSIRRFHEVVPQQGRATVLDEDSLRKQILATRGLFWFMQERTFVRHNGTSLELRTLSDAPLTAQLLDLFSMRKGIITIEDIHSIRSRSSYNPIRHGAATHALIARCRAVLRSLGGELSFSHDTGGFLLSHPARFFAVRSVGRSARRTSLVVENTRRDILHFLDRHGTATVSELGTAIALSRQSLHRHLISLMDFGLVEQVKRGKATFYMKTTRALHPSTSS